MESSAKTSASPNLPLIAKRRITVTSCRRTLLLRLLSFSRKRTRHVQAKATKKTRRGIGGTALAVTVNPYL